MPTLTLTLNPILTLTLRRYGTWIFNGGRISHILMFDHGLSSDLESSMRRITNPNPEPTPNPNPNPNIKFCNPKPTNQGDCYVLLSTSKRSNGQTIKWSKDPEPREDSVEYEYSVFSWLGRRATIAEQASSYPYPYP